MKKKEKKKSGSSMGEEAGNQVRLGRGRIKSGSLSTQGEPTTSQNPISDHRSARAEARNQRAVHGGWRARPPVAF